MRAHRPSVTARHVALQRAGFDRPTLPTGDAQAESRLYRSLGASRLPSTAASTLRMQRRTAFFDRETLAALGRGVTQVVTVAAGYDGRSLRFASPGVRWFEVDHPATQRDKRARLTRQAIAADNVTFVPVDLTNDDLTRRLQEAGHDSTAASLFIVEGILGYLTREVAAALLAELRSLAGSGSRLAAAFPIRPREGSASERLRLRVRSLVVSLVGEPWLYRYAPDEPDSVLAEAGWEIGTAVASGRGGLPGLARYEGRQGVLVGAVPAPSA